MIVVVGVGEEIILSGENKRLRKVLSWQSGIRWILDFEDLLPVVIHVPSLLVAEVGIDASVSDDLDRLLDPDGAMIRRDDQLDLAFGDLLDEFKKR